MAKKGSYGHPGSSGLAQSGGRNTTFGGGKGGTATFKADTNQRRIGGGVNNAGLDYSVRTEGGGKSLKPASFHVGAPPPLRGGESATKTVKVKVRKPIRGGAA